MVNKLDAVLSELKDIKGRIAALEADREKTDEQGKLLVANQNAVSELMGLLTSEDPAGAEGARLSISNSPALARLSREQAAYRARVGRAAGRAGFASVEEWERHCQEVGWPDPSRTIPRDFARARDDAAEDDEPEGGTGR